MRRYLLWLILLFFVVTKAEATTSNPYQTNTAIYNSSQPLQGMVMMVPPGTIINAITTTELNTKDLILGQSINTVIPQDFYYNNQLIAPAGSIVNGTITEIKKASFGSRNARLKVRFTSITTPFGQTLPISAIIKTTDETGVIKGGTIGEVTKAYATDIAAGAAAGAIAGAFVGAISDDGEVGKNTVVGTAIGAGAGLLKSFSDKGEEVIIPPNTVIGIELDQPATINSTSVYMY